jgi:hypothetical protein
MKQLPRPRLTYANVVATLALFIAIGGTSAFAATQLAKNSVGTKQLKNGAVTRAKLAESAQGGRGPEGKQGPIGQQGTPGPPGAPGATRAVVRGGDFSESVVKKCAQGEVATGGGGYSTTESGGVGMIGRSVPVENGEGVPIGWEIESSSEEEQPGYSEAYVVCVSP